MVAVEPSLKGQRALWRLEPRLPDALRAQLPGLSPMLCHLLYCRGYQTADAIQEFFAAATISHDPFDIPGMTEAVVRLAAAIEQQEIVAIYGDFDCDGLTATAILQDTLRGYGLQPIIYLPTRDDGHGLHLHALTQLADQGVSLLLTADCGVTDMSAVQAARGMGIDVVVTDHHEPRADGSLPDCPTVNPVRHDSLYPCPWLCGAGVAYKVTQALAKHTGSGSDPDSVLDLVALGTVADVVPLRGENRSLVLQGLRQLEATKRPGLLALFQVAGIHIARISPVTIGFALAPRVNAANRLAAPQMAYDLLTASDPATALKLAEQLSEYNRQRQDLVAHNLQALLIRIGSVSTVMGEVLAGDRPPVLIELGEWPAGISGLLASKLVEQYGLPAFVGGITTDGLISISARGGRGAHIDEILEACEASQPGGIFVGYGGHARAGGFRLQQDRWPLAQQTLEDQARAGIVLDDLGAALAIDVEVSLAQLTTQAARMIERLAPFGNEFPEPLFLVRNVTLRRCSPIGTSKQHARCTLQQGSTWLDGVMFNADAGFVASLCGSTLDVVGHLTVNEWKGSVKPQLQLRDWRMVSPTASR